jgi:hypothetical protein
MWHVRETPVGGSQNWVNDLGGTNWTNVSGALRTDSWMIPMNASLSRLCFRLLALHKID